MSFHFSLAGRQRCSRHASSCEEQFRRRENTPKRHIVDARRSCIRNSATPLGRSIQPKWSRPARLKALCTIASTTLLHKANERRLMPSQHFGQHFSCPVLLCTSFLLRFLFSPTQNIKRIPTRGYFGSGSFCHPSSDKEGLLAVS